MSEGAHGNRARIGVRFRKAVPRWGEQAPSGTPPDPFPVFSGSNRTKGQLSLSESFRTKSERTLLGHLRTISYTSALGLLRVQESEATSRERQNFSFVTAGKGSDTYPVTLGFYWKKL